MTEGMEDISAVPAHPSGSASPTSSTVDTGQVPKEKPEETEAAGESGEDGAEETAEGGGGGGDDGGDGEHLEALGIVALPGTCCVCIEMEQINNCLHSEKICILPILACLLSLALCIAGLKWVFVDKIFEYEPPTHLDPKPIGQDPIIISVDPTLGLTVSVPHSSPSTASLTTAITVTPGHPEVFVEEESTRGPYVPQSPRVTQSDPSVTLKYNADHPTNPKQTQHPRTTQEYNDIIIPTISATSTTTTARTSSHVTRCRDSQKNYCVNGGECFTLEIMPGSTKFLCRKQRKKLHDRLRQSLRKKRNNNTNTGTGPNSARGRQISNLPLQDLQLINQCNGMTMQHADEKETETTFSTSKYALCAHEPTTLTHISSQRFVSAMRSPTQLSPVSQISPETPGSPPSELSAPLSSLAISVPSVALSLSGEEERPLLLSNGHPPHKPLSRDEQKRNSAHYNHGHMAHSLPPSPLFTMENVNYQIIGDGDTKAAGHMFSEASEKLINTNNINDRSNKKTGVTNGHVLHNVDSSGDNKLVSETLEPRREHTPFLTTDNTTALLIRVMDSRRTNPASPNDSVQVK
uniref:pro-neuregulin-1, membrane-bound isoform isoform X2 n=1 Tax=Monopterus albus TaxID=43700 RepID=UPI0009B3039B|nr:pro-neuregulin-1, membrane-bound isoform-like isoform X2 [Monopterus albus]